jgi:hypothetical protein
VSRSVVFALVALLAACSKQEPPAPEAAPVPTQAPAPTPSAAAPVPSASVAATPEDVPVEEDFEDEAGSSVTAQTLDSQLDALEKEIKAN